MQYRQLGRTGIQVSTYCLGTAFFGSQTPLDSSIAIIHRALDLGVNFVDTANTYGDARFTVPGYPQERPVVEEIVGRAIAGRRHEVVLATKVCEPVGPGPNQRGLARRFIMQQAEISLRRLGTDHVDLYYAHHPDPFGTPIEESLRAFDDLVHQGKVRHVAISNFAGWQVVEALWAADRRDLAAPVCMQMLYNLLDRDAEREQLPALAAHGLGALAWSPLAGGVLAGRYRPGDAPPKESRGAFWASRTTSLSRPGSVPQRNTSNLAKAEALAAWSADRGHTSAQVGLAWLLGNPHLTAVIAGASTLEQLESNVAASDLALTADERDEIVRLVDQA